MEMTILGDSSSQTSVNVPEKKKRLAPCNSNLEFTRRVVRGAAGGKNDRSPITFDGMVFVPSTDGITKGWDGI